VNRSNGRRRRTRGRHTRAARYANDHIAAFDELRDELGTALDEMRVFVPSRRAISGHYELGAQPPVQHQHPADADRLRVAGDCATRREDAARLTHGRLYAVAAGEAEPCDDRPAYRAMLFM